MRARERQLAQAASVKPPAMARPDRIGVIAHDLIDLQGDAVAGDRVFHDAKRFKLLRQGSEGTVGGLLQIGILG